MECDGVGLMQDSFDKKIIYSYLQSRRDADERRMRDIIRNEGDDMDIGQVGRDDVSDITRLIDKPNGHFGQ